MREEEVFEKHHSDLLRSAELLDRVFTVMDDVHLVFGELFAEWFRLRETLLDLDLLELISPMEAAMEGVGARLDMLFGPGSARSEPPPLPEPERGASTLTAVERHLMKLDEDVAKTRPRVMALVDALAEAVEPLQEGLRMLDAGGADPLGDDEGDPSQQLERARHAIDKFIEGLLQMRAACEHVAMTMGHCEPALKEQLAALARLRPRSRPLS